MANVNIKIIAQKTNLSPGTVSIVLNGRGDKMRISEKTQNRVWEEAKLLGYKPNIYARRLRNQSAGNSAAIIGILWPSVYSSELIVSFFDGIQNSILNDKLNVEVVFKPYQYSEISKMEDVFKNQLFNGVIIVGASDRDVDYMYTIKSAMPIILFNRQNDKYGSVCIDNYDTGKKVAGLLAARKHKKVGLISPNLLSRNFSMRRTGFLDGCQKYGISVLPEHIIQETIDSEGGYRSAEKLLRSESLPTALFLLVSGYSHGVYSVFQKNGVRIPEDIEIIGCSDIVSSRILKPSMTVIDLPVQKMVKKSLLLILDMINGYIQDPHIIFEEAPFIFRESCGGFPDSGSVI
ncbi:LacI family DNA-binding transcriptional regulator [Ruminiclostridium cellulolyticum]|uniref:Transcriptional regulator, LacI family n=1 Tax=Ruminiclostridium cellulolyticum (strain ATCC 35319 / DSM 5812 / JCM 6584 / H10) TaxID=394503 RepID=B8I289_RUMCH|nr:LacI family DNA-binding transcriptional regulator [Ruminiclostridium cellulolyticum]ACL77752.1 transcriptional regulator, LacI family [Ruminiclostridium cellulolyticum H10]